MKIVSAIIMLIGLIDGLIILIQAESAPQQAISLVPIIGAYVLGRALENFVNKDEEVIILLRKLTEPKSKAKFENPSNEIDSDVKVQKKKENLSNDAKKLIKKLKDDEMLIKMKTNKEFGSLKIIKKSKYDTDKDLHLTKDYQVIFKNSKK